MSDPDHPMNKGLLMVIAIAVVLAIIALASLGSWMADEGYVKPVRDTHLQAPGTTLKELKASGHNISVSEWGKQSQVVSDADVKELMGKPPQKVIPVHEQ